MTGIKDGFHIVDPGGITGTSQTDNYSSATNPEVRPLVEKQINFEISHGHYQVTNEQPKIISALGAIPKGRGKGIRLIHDCSRPVGNALNEYATHDPFQYQTIQDAVDNIVPNSYLAKIDLSQAYRVVKIHPSNYCATGLRYKFSDIGEPVIMIDTRLPFGPSKSPSIFNELTQAVRHIMCENYGHSGITVYLDDFLITQPTYSQCNEVMHSLMKVLRSLGFWINYSKVEGPKQKLTFLGISIDTTTMKLSLPDDKVKDLVMTLQQFKSKTKVTKKMLQRLAGKLNWACQCIYGGRFHLRRILDCITRLKKP